MAVKHVIERPFRRESGYAFTAALPPDIASKAASDEYFLVFQEDGEELGPADALHDDIRRHGLGAYSFWNDVVYFSSATNDDCEKNGRQYVVWLFEAAEGSPLDSVLLEHVVKNNGRFLRAAAINAGRNNSVMSNFFGYGQLIGEWIARSGANLPQAMLELGCGRIPWTGLRFLLEGTQHYVATDIMKVRRAFPASEIADLRAICTALRPQLLDRWSAVLGDVRSEITPVGLEIRDQAGLETQDFHGTRFDLAISSSVLEHVVDPVGVYNKLAEVTRLGGWMYHSIDLRDHRYLESDPLAFLHDTEEQYASINTENRLRASDHRCLLERSGFEIVHERVNVIEEGGAKIWTENPKDVRPYVCERSRAKMAVRFRSHDLVDLSTISIQILCHRR